MSDLRYELAVVCGTESQRLAPFGVDGLVRHLVAQHCITRPRQTKRGGWVEHVAGPGAFAQAIFDQPAEVPFFDTLVVAHGATARPLPFEGEPSVFFYIMLTGACFDRVGAGFLGRVDQLLRCAPRVLVRAMGA